MNNIYVMPYKGVWGVNKEKTDEMISVHDSKEEALEVAKSLIAGKDSNIIILRADGTIDNLEEDPLEPFIPDNDE